MEKFPLPNCKRCGHTADLHRLDDSTNQDPTDPETTFRCTAQPIFKDDEPCNCPDYIEP